MKLINQVKFSNKTKKLFFREVSRFKRKNNYSENRLETLCDNLYRIFRGFFKKDLGFEKHLKKDHNKNVNIFFTIFFLELIQIKATTRLYLY